MAAPIQLLPREIVDRIVAYALWPIVEFYNGVFKEINNNVGDRSELMLSNILIYKRMIFRRKCAGIVYPEVDKLTTVRCINMTFHNSTTEYLYKYRMLNGWSHILFTTFDHSYLIYEWLFRYGSNPSISKYELISAAKQGSIRTVKMLCRMIKIRKIRVELSLNDMGSIKSAIDEWFYREVSDIICAACWIV